MNSPEKTHEIPKEWNKQAHSIWDKGERAKAIETVVNEINAISEKKPRSLLTQLGFYLFFVNDYVSSSTVFRNILELYPDDKESLLNLIISLSKAQLHRESIKYAVKFLKDDPSNFAAWDSITKSYYAINETEKAKRAGTNSLKIKENNSRAIDPTWRLPKNSIQSTVANKKKVIAFSLWGNHERYIYGALRNLLLAPDIYPDWEIWIYADSTVPGPFLNIFNNLGARIIMQAGNQTKKQKLCWRFNVANSPEVGYFLVRDIDSVFSVREYNTVQQWLDSEKWFHIIRDWWTHTDLVLAGLWGGVAGVLPNLQTLLEAYEPDIVATPNIDQWFLRDCVWGYIKTSCLIHDRCFKQKGAVPISGPEPTENVHIGSCEYMQRPEFQKKILSPWIGGGNVPRSPI